jgi:mitochondrial FAD-linked sulfhydryl oxidase
MNKFTTNLNNNKVSLGEKCDTCTDFQDWMSMNKTKPILNNNNERPLFRDEYGRVAWTYLHTMAAYYPKEASKEQQTSMSQFITTFTEFFPCKECAEDFKDE